MYVQIARGGRKMTTTKTFKGNGADKILAEKIIKKVTETGQ